MQVRELLMPGAYEFTPVQHGDPRGVFLEWFKVERLEEAYRDRTAIRERGARGAGFLHRAWTWRQRTAEMLEVLAR